MAAYEPPKQILPIFDVNNFFFNQDNALTLGEAEKIFVKNTNGFISNTLSVGGDTTLYGNLSIPSYPDVKSELQSIDTTLTDMSYYSTDTGAYIADSTRINNYFFVDR